MNSWQRIRDEVVRRVLGFSPFEVEDDLRRLRKLVDRLRDEQAHEVERLRAELRRLGGDVEAPSSSGPARPAPEAPANGAGAKKHLPIV
jgi:hypothetical protein